MKRKPKFDLPGNWVQQSKMALILAQLLLTRELGKQVEEEPKPCPKA